MGRLNLDFGPTYCLDTSVYINGWTKHYPPRVFESVWVAIDDALRKQTASSPREVLEEIRQKSDGLCKWADEREFAFPEHSQEVQLALKVILRTKAYRTLVDAKKGRDKGDPWVIAHAQAYGAIVVAEENYSSPDVKKKKLKIPDVCKALDIKYIRTADFLEAIGFKMK